MSSKKNNVSDLLAAIKRQPTAPTQEKVEPAIVPVEATETAEPMKRHSSKKPATAKKSAEGKRGKPVQFWMHDDDRKLVRELSAWLAGQGVRPSDSMVIRAALRLAKTGSGLLEAYWQAAKLDGRIKRD
jgi:hypothetical protein